MRPRQGLTVVVFTANKRRLANAVFWAALAGPLAYAIGLACEAKSDVSIMMAIVAMGCPLLIYRLTRKHESRSGGMPNRHPARGWASLSISTAVTLLGALMVVLSNPTLLWVLLLAYLLNAAAIVWGWKVTLAKRVGSSGSVVRLSAATSVNLAVLALMISAV